MSTKQHFSAASLTGDATYRLLSSLVVPRPIAWVSTLGLDGMPNLAPHSYFNAVSNDPPIVMFSAERTGDTAANITATGEFVINIVPEALSEAMEVTASAVDGSVNEFALAGLGTSRALGVAPPLVTDAPAALECVVTKTMHLGESLMVIGAVIGFHVGSGLMGDSGRVEPDRLSPLGRLGEAYTSLGNVFRQDRPTPESLNVDRRAKVVRRRDVGGAHLVGSVPRDSAAEVIEASARHLGAHLAAIPDGETGDRLDWTTFQAVHVFHPNSALETISQPASFAENPDAWRPGDLEEDAWLFRIRDGAGVPHFGSLGYVKAAVESYKVFKELQAQGAVGQEVRFQVSLPAPQSAVSWWFHDPDDADRVNAAYTHAMADEVRRLCEAIPHDDLTIQWDACWETVVFEQVFDWAPSGDPMERIAMQTPVISMGIPDKVMVGYHFCYGSMHDEHFVEPTNLSRCVELSNFVVNNSGRRIDFVHMPVPIGRDDDAYYAPLRGLRIGGCRVYLGLVHHEDGGEGAKRRIEVAQRHLLHFGVAAECGFGRMDPADVVPLLVAHSEAADSLSLP